MNAFAPARMRWCIVVLFAVAMAWLEAASVYYLRVVVDRVVPYQPNPLPAGGVLGSVELVREAATLVMLLMVGILGGRRWHERLGYSAIAFGVWDIFYYVFLQAISGLADLAPRLGRSVPAAAAVVGTGACARLHRATDGRVGHPHHTVRRTRRGNSAHVDTVGPRRARHRSSRFTCSWPMQFARCRRVRT